MVGELQLWKREGTGPATICTLVLRGGPHVSSTSSERAVLFSPVRNAKGVLHFLVRGGPEKDEDSCLLGLSADSSPRFMVNEESSWSMSPPLSFGKVGVLRWCGGTLEFKLT